MMSFVNPKSIHGTHDIMSCMREDIPRRQTNTPSVPIEWTRNAILHHSRTTDSLKEISRYEGQSRKRLKNNDCGLRYRQSRMTQFRTPNNESWVLFMLEPLGETVESSQVCPPSQSSTGIYPLGLGLGSGSPGVRLASASTKPSSFTLRRFSGS